MANLCKVFTYKNRIKPLSFLSLAYKQQVCSVFHLAEIGHFEKPNTTEINYEQGQLFFHKTFAYRGIVLFPWRARVVDRTAKEDYNDLEYVMKGQEQTIENYYYQVLIDSRDRPLMRNFTQNEAVTYLRSANTDNGLCSVPGMDYVSHDDIQPYTSIEKNCIHHELFDYFFSYNSDERCWTGKPDLRAWRLKNSSWLDFSKVYVETTRNVRITAIPFYIGYQKTSKSKKNWWRYLIRIENFDSLQMQLRTHHWRVIGISGLLENVKGDGVVGQEPFLCNRYPVFQYHSHISLYSAGGYMWGTYILEKEDGKSIECRIPLFSLKSKDSDSTSTPLTKKYLA